MNLSTSITQSPTHTILVATSLTAALALAWAAHDYYAWVRFGTGGTPPNLWGYLKITKFRVQRAFSADRLTDASRLPVNGVSYLAKPLPPRRGDPPKVLARTLPQRQQPAPLDRDIYIRLHHLPHLYAQKYPKLLVIDKSVTEGRSTDAIYTRPNLPGRKHGARDPVLGDEIAHVHPAENSLHVWLTTTDTRKVVEAGWGQRFPLSALGIVDDGWTFIYAPRSMEEVDVVEEVFKAGIAHLTGDKTVME